MSTDTLSFAGDVTVEELSIISSDGTKFSVINQMVAIQIFEDIFSPFITGSLIVKDSLDFVNAIPIIGQETLVMDISTPSLKDKFGRIQQQFCIYRIKNREVLGDKSITYELDFMSKEAIVDWNVKISKSYVGKVSDIAREILTDERVKFNNTKNLIIEETNNKTKYISNYWSPIKNINYLCENAKGDIGNSPSYVFFENRDGFNFCSLNLLVQSPTVTQHFNYNNTTRPIDSTGTAFRDVGMDYQRISSISITEGPNTLNRVRNGFMASTLITNDITMKKYEYNYFNAFFGHQITKHLNEFPLVNWRFPITYESKIITEPKYSYNFSGFRDATNTDFLQNRIYEIQEKTDFKISIIVPGRFDYTVGQIMDVMTFKMQPANKSDINSDIEDEIISGRYLTTAINHFITREKHECTIELSKDSFIKDFSQSR